MRWLRAGFDLRVRPDLPDDDWTFERRETFLLRREVARPLSTDRAVWPSAAERAAPMPWDPQPDDVPPGMCAVAIGVAGDGHRFGATEELVPESSWLFLGCDVSDEGMLSGLMNCGYTPGAELDALRAAWATRLNEHGLLVDIDAAERFRALSDERVVEHAPFHVFGLWRLPASHP